MKRAMVLTEPQSSISLPNSAPSRNSGKNCATKPAALLMKVCGPVRQQRLAGERRRDQRRRPAPAAARSSRDRRSQISSAEADEDAEQSHGSHPSASRSSIVERRALAERRAMCRRGRRSAARAALVAQHGQEVPFGVQLRRGAELGQLLAARSGARASGPMRAFARCRGRRPGAAAPSSAAP